MTAVRQYETAEEYANRARQVAWSLPFDAVDPTGADDYFFYLKNTGEKALVATKLVVMSTVAGFVEVQKVTGTAGGSVSTLTPVNKTIGSGRTPSATINYSVDVTGLSDAGHLEHLYLPANTLTQVSFAAGLRLRKNDAIALLWTAATGVLTGAMSIYEED